MLAVDWGPSQSWKLCQLDHLRVACGSSQHGGWVPRASIREKQRQRHGQMKVITASSDLTLEAKQHHFCHIWSVTISPNSRGTGRVVEISPASQWGGASLSVQEECLEWDVCLVFGKHSLPPQIWSEIFGRSHRSTLMPYLIQGLSWNSRAGWLNGWGHSSWSYGKGQVSPILSFSNKWNVWKIVFNSGNSTFSIQYSGRAFQWPRALEDAPHPRVSHNIWAPAVSGPQRMPDGITTQERI